MKIVWVKFRIKIHDKGSWLQDLQYRTTTSINENYLEFCRTGKGGTQNSGVKMGI